MFSPRQQAGRSYSGSRLAAVHGQNFHAQISGGYLPPPRQPTRKWVLPNSLPPVRSFQVLCEKPPSTHRYSPAICSATGRWSAGGSTAQV